MAHGHGEESSGQGRGGRSREGRGRGGRGGRGHGGIGATASRKQLAKQHSDSILPCATTISTADPVPRDSDNFCPLRDPGPHIQPETQASALDLFELWFDNSIMDHTLWCMYAYADLKESKKGRYKKKKAGSRIFLLSLVHSHS